MIRLFLLPLMLAACGAKAPEALHEPRPTERSAVKMRDTARGMTPISRTSAVEKPVVLGQKPDFDPDTYVPDSGPILRWPLSPSSHPELVPQFPIARVLAEPGVGWMELCRRGAHNRHAGPKLRDQFEYLSAWCAVGEHDVNRAIQIFGSLTKSTVSGLVPAVRQDVVNVLVQEGRADDATRLLSRHQIRDLEVLDLLAATYADMGKDADATEINELSILRDDVNRGNRCRRQARRVVMAPEMYRSPVNRDVALFDEPEGADRICDRLAAELACWLRPSDDCEKYFKIAGIDPRMTHVISAFHAWPAVDRGPNGWEAVAITAMAGGTLPLAYEFAVSALEQSARSGRCMRHYTLRLGRYIQKLRAPADRPKQFDDRLEVLDDEPQELCKHVGSHPPPPAP